MSDVMRQLVPADDEFHPSGDDIWWTETAWYSLEDADSGLSLHVYPLFRPNLPACSLEVIAWDASGALPWNSRYSSFRWNLPSPTTPLSRLDFEGLSYRTIEPNRRYQVRFVDPGKIEIDLEWSAIDDPWIKTGGNMLGVDFDDPGAVRIGHYEQACFAKGTIRLGERTIAIDTVGMRDRSWSPRPDRGTGSLFHCYGMSREHGHFIVNRSRADGGPIDEWMTSSGYISQGGRTANVARSRLSDIERDANGAIATMRLEAVDVEGRSIDVIGRCTNHFYWNPNPNLYCIAQQTVWTASDGGYLGTYMGPIAK